LSEVKRPGDFGAAVIGTGFIGGVHVEALRRLGVTVTGVLGSSPERGAERAPALGVAKAYEDIEALCADPAVDVVHVTSPNKAHFEQVRALMEAGKHVICEKPLAMTAEQSAQMVEWEARTDRICAVNYNTRFYPLNQHAHQMVADGALGEVRLVSGHYLQDWLLKDTDWNWRLDEEEGGALRAFGDIGTHWVDLTGFITGLRIEAVFAELATFHQVRQQPVGPVETFSKAAGETRPREIRTDDAALVMLRYANGARGQVTISQVSAGRKNAMSWEVDGSEAAASWHSETPDHMWIGHRDEPNQVLQRDAALMNATGAAAASLPGGHVEGFGDTHFAHFREVYRAIAAGRRPERPLYATFADGHEEMRVCEAVLRSSREGRWVKLDEI
jgi:predicted dehydrogenase